MNPDGNHPRAPGPAGRLIQALDRRLRRVQGIVEFTTDPRCVFRIAPGHAPRDVVLSDGVRVRAGEPVLALHLWNEHVPALPPEGPSLAWATRARAALGHSLALLARHLAAERGPRAVWGRMAFPAALGHGKTVALVERVGFDVTQAPAQGWLGRAHRLGDRLLASALLWHYNPAVLRRRGAARHWYELWMSCERLLARYGTGPCE